MSCLEERFNMKLLVVPLMVEVSALIHRVVLFIGKLLALLKLPSMSYLKMAVIAKQDTVSEVIRTTVLYWLSVMRLPSPACAFGAVFPNKPFTASTASSSLSVPSLLYSGSRKHTKGTSRGLVASGWVNNGKGLHVLRQDGKFTDAKVVAMPFMYHNKSKRPVYDIYYGNKYLGYAFSLHVAKRRAEAYLRKARRS